MRVETTLARGAENSRAWRQRVGANQDSSGFFRERTCRPLVMAEPRLHRDTLPMAEFIPNSAIFHDQGLVMFVSVSTAASQIGGRMAELLMNSAIARLDVPLGPASPILGPDPEQLSDSVPLDCCLRMQAEFIQMLQ